MQLVLAETWLPGRPKGTSFWLSLFIATQVLRSVYTDYHENKSYLSHLVHIT